MHTCVARVGFLTCPGLWSAFPTWLSVALAPPFGMGLTVAGQCGTLTHFPDPRASVVFLKRDYKGTTKNAILLLFMVNISIKSSKFVPKMNKAMKYNTIIFDLDGTLTDTLYDLMLSTNHALLEMGWPERTLEEVRQFVGNGVRRLMEQAVPSDTEEEEFEECFRIFQEHYVEHCQDHTGLYPGIAELLQELHQRGYKMAIVSNKLQAGVDELYSTFFQDTIQVAIGEREGVRRKPMPDMVQLALEQLGSTPEESIYVGDSEVDMATARNAGLPCISVLWGFRDQDYLREIGAFRMVSTPAEILNLV